MTSTDTNILIVEDDDALRDALLDTAAIAGFTASGAAHGRAALEALSEMPFDLVISDIQMDPMDGHALLREIRKRDRDLPVVLMTAYESIQSAVKALRDGATDYLVKPFEAEVLVGRIDEWLPSPASPADDDIVAAGPITRQVFELARRVAASDASIMITGESGVGKEVVFARFIATQTALATHPWHSIAPRSRRTCSRRFYSVTKRRIHRCLQGLSR